MEITNAEKLILYMLSEIHAHLKIKGGVDPQFVQNVISDGNTWAFEWKFPGVFEGGNDKTPEAVEEVVDILDMWSQIEYSYGKLSPADKKRVKAEADPYGNARFDGFDGNHEGEQLSIARCLIDDLDRFSSFKKRDLNSHLPLSLDGYRRMLKVFLPLRSSLANGPFTASQVISMLKERMHPSVRDKVK